MSTGQRAAVAAKWVEFFAVEAKKRVIAAQNNDLGRSARAKLPEQDSGRARDKAAARWVEFFAVEAKKRQLSGLKQNQQDRSVVAKLPQREKRQEGTGEREASFAHADKWKSRAKAASMFNVSPRSVSNAKKRQVKAGKVYGNGSNAKLSAKLQKASDRFRASVNNGLNQQSVAKLPHSELGKARDKADTWRVLRLLCGRYCVLIVRKFARGWRERVARPARLCVLTTARGAVVPVVHSALACHFPRCRRGCGHASLWNQL